MLDAKLGPLVRGYSNVYPFNVVAFYFRPTESKADSQHCALGKRKQDI